MTLLQTINHHLAATGLAPTRFGREALGDARFVKELRGGRCPRPATVAKVEAYLARAR